MNKFLTYSALLLTLVATPALAVYDLDGGGGGGGSSPTVSLSTSPTSISSGSSATLTWSSFDAAYGCYGDVFSASGTSGSTTVSPTVTTTYTVYCDNDWGTGYASATVTVTAATTKDLTAGGVSPTTATVGTAVTLSSTVSNSGTGSTGASFTNLFQRATDASGTSATDIGTHSASTLAAGGSTSATLSYTFPSAATWYVRACADKSSSASTGTITESNESNNCGAWTAVVASATASTPTATISASPTSITSGQSSTITWSSTNATSCTGTGFSTGNQTSGTASVSPTSSTTYSVSCTGTGGSASGSATVTVSGAAYNTTSYGNKICSGGTSVGTYAASSNTCVSYCTGLSASCCTTKTVYFEDDGSTSYTCYAYTGTQSTVTTNASSQCSYVSGEPINCRYTSWEATTINYGPAVTASLVSNPTSISAGQSALLTWSSANATTCTGTNFSTGDATSGSVTVSPSTTTTYSLSCTGAGGTATDSETLTVNIFTVTCSASPSPVTVLQPVSWSSAVTGGTGSYTYAWTGTDGVSSSASSVNKTYETLGEKTATLSVTSGADTISAICNGSPCQQASCTCTGAGCGVVVQEGISSDITATIPTITGGAAFPGGTLSFSASINNIGNNSISRAFTNRFQIDVGNDGTYDVSLDTGGGTNSNFTLEYGKTCTTGSIVNTSSMELYGAGDLADSITAICEDLAVSGQCCAAAVTSTGGGGGGGDGGVGGNVNLVERIIDRSVAAAYKSLAYTDGTSYQVDVTVYSSPTTSTCTSGTCYAGTWQGQTGTLYDIPYSGALGVNSPTWTNVPGGTHKVRMCADSPTSQLSESNENNNCGPDYTFTVTGFDLIGGASGLNSGQLIGGQEITFFGTVLNNPSSYSESGQCSATVVVTSGGACSISLNQDQIQWSTTGATIVDSVGPITDGSPTVPATGSSGLIITPYEDYYNPPAVAADLMANGGLTLYTSGHGFYSGTNVTPNRLCYLIDGITSYAYSYTQTSFNSPGNNYIYKWEPPLWKKYGASAYNNKLRYTLKCAKPGSPYTLSGTYTFPSPLGPGTHTYELNSNAASPNDSCQATIVIPSQTSGLCQITPNPSIITSGQSSTLTWTLNGASSLSCDQGLGTVTSNQGQSCLPSGTELSSMGLCTEAGVQTFEWSQCCSGTARQRCPAPNEPVENYCWGTDPGESNEVVVSPNQTTTYTCTATTDSSIFDFSGCAPGEFQIDENNDGTWDTTLATSQCMTSLGVTQSLLMTSPAWTAVPGTHAVRFCANTPVSGGEGITDNNCGEEYVFVVSDPTQCADGLDNNGNDLIDLDDPACTSGGDVSEESYSAAVLSITASRNTVKNGAGVTLTWSASEVVADSCVITSTVGNSWPQSGSTGTQSTGGISGETTYTLSCTSMQTGEAVSVSTTVKLTPRYEET